MKKAILAAAVFGCAVAAWGGMGVLWSTGGGWVVEPGGDLNVGPGAAANGAVTWQLIYAGENDQIDEIDCGSEHGLGGDDELLAERVVPAGGGAATDGTVWDVWVMAEEGFFTYENAEWTKAGHVFQRMFLGTPEPGAAYAETGLFAYNLGYKNGTEGGDPPDLFYFDPAGNGVSLDRTIPGTGYDLWVGGVRVSEGNAGDVLGDGTVRFEGTATNGTLLLSNAVVTNAYVFVSPNSANLYAGEGFDLTVRVEGSNRLANTAADGYAVYAEGALAITGDGVLVGEEGMAGIVARGNLSIDGATVVAKGGTTGLAGSNVAISNATVHAAGWARGVGIPGRGNVSIVDSKVVATGKAGGVSISGALSVEGASQLEAEATMAGGVAVDADGGITIGEGLAVVVPVGGGRSADGKSIVDAEGNAALRAAIAAAGSLVGSGTEADPYVIYDYGTLVAFAGAVNGGQFDAWGVLVADIAATEADWVAIGTNSYYGTFDGAGHTISGLANAGTPDYAGLFGFVDSGGVVRNVRLAGVAFSGMYAGGVAGYNLRGVVSNCCVSGSVHGNNVAGGVAGVNLGTIANCYNTGAVSGSSGIGGIVGNNGYGGRVQNCHNSGEVSGGARGGVVGYNGGTVENSYCSKGLPIGGDNNGTVIGECKELGAREYTDERNFRGWNFRDVWGMGAEGPYLRVLGERVEYPVWVDGVQVTDANSGDILGNGTARFAGTMSWGTLMLTNAVITNAVVYASPYTAGIYAGEGFDLTISLGGSNRVENAAEDGNGIRAEGNLSLGGAGSLTVEGGDHAAGIYAEGNLRIENTTVTASGITGLCSQGGNTVLTNAIVSATGLSFGIYANKTVAFAGASRVEATTTERDGDPVFAWSGITVGGGLDLVEPDGGGLEANGTFFVDANGNAAVYVLIAPTVYDLWVGGVQVCSTNAGDVLGDGRVRFEGTEAGGTLALSNAVVTGAVEFESWSGATAVISAGNGFDLTISLDGSNRVENAEPGGVGIHVKGNLSLGGEGSLTAEGGENGNAISAAGNLRIENTTVTASGVNGLSSRGNIVLTNATVTATGGLNGIYTSGTLAFSGASRVEATGSYMGAVYANDGIALEDGIGVALPVGGGVSGGTIADSEGNAAGYAMVARLYSIRVTGGSSTNQVAAEGFSIEVTVNDPDEDGKAFVQWSSDDVRFEDAGASPTRFTMPATNVAVEAVFKPIVLTWRDDPAEYPYTGGEIEPPFDVALEGVDLYLGTNYTVSWADNVNVGTATLTVTLTNRPSGVQSNSFRIKPKALDEESVELNLPTVGWCTFDGTALQPGFNIKDPALHESDLVVVWTNNVGPGTASVLFTGTNNYAGRVVKTFEIRWASETVAGTEWSYRTDLGGGTNATVTGASPAEGELTAPGTLGGVPVAGIGDRAFEGCTNLTGFVMGDGVQDIGEEAFKGCTGLTNVVLGAGIESVGDNAFAGCDALETVWVPIGQQGTGLLDAAGLPDGCEVRYYGTQTVTFEPNGGTCGTRTNSYTIGEAYGALPEASWTLHTFDGWRATNGTAVSAASIVTEEAERTLAARWKNGVVVSNVLWLCETNAAGGATVTGAVPAEGDMVMPESLDGVPVTEVGPGAFGDCTNLTGMAVAGGVTNIGAEAFGGCTGLASAEWPEGLESIGDGAFRDSGLTEAAIPDSVASIGDEAFAGCTGLTNAVLGAGIESVGANAFAGCDALESVWVPIGQQGTGLLDAAGLPDGCEVRYYGTQTVTFEPNGGTCGTRTNVYTIGAEYGALPTPEREGYDFGGWWDEVAGEEVEAGSVVTEAAERTLTAHWSQSQRTLTVQAGRWGRAVAVVGGRTNVVAAGKTASFSVTYGTAVTVTAVADAGFAVEGEDTATFPSFQTDADVAFAFRPEPTATLKWKYARNANGWFCAQIAIPWHAGYGEALGNLRFLFADRTDAAGKATAYLVDTGTVFGALGRVETHEGRKYRAAGIDTKGFASLSGGKRAVFGVGDATLKSSLASVPKEERKIALRVVNRNLDTVKPLDDKVGFLAWETGGTTRYLAISPDGTAATRGVRRSLRDFADWEEEPVPEVIAAARSYTVAFDANGGTGRMAKQSMTSGKAAKLRKNAFKRNGWVFTGWAKSKTGKVVYKDQAKVQNLGAAGKAVTLYAKWAKKSYTVAFDANGGKGKMAKQSMTYGKAAKLRKNAFRRSGWVFTGWAKSKTGKVVYKDQASVKNLRADGKTTTLYAKWAKKSYTVAFDANGGKGRMAKQSMTYGKAAKLRKNAFTSDGRTFLGWAASKDGPVLYADQAKVKNLRADGKTKTLYAKWRRTFQIDYAATGDASSQAAGATSPRAVKSEKRKVKRGNGVVVTTSDGSDGAAVADGDEGTSWSPEGPGWTWVVLAFPAPRDVADVEVVGDHLPEGTRILLSEDAAEWRETAAGRAQYVWVAFPDGEETPAVREIRVAEAAAAGREERLTCARQPKRRVFGKRMAP